MTAATIANSTHQSLAALAFATCLCAGLCFPATAAPIYSNNFETDAAGFTNAGGSVDVVTHIANLVLAFDFAHL